MENTKTLIKKLNHLPRPLKLADLEKALEESSGVDEELISLSVPSEFYYTRNLIYSGIDFDMLLLTWKPRQRSPLHNHRGSACVVRVLQGVATEITYEKGPSGMLYPTKSNQAAAGSVISSYDADIHQMSNLGTEVLVTLHIYAPSLKSMEIFTLTDTCLERYDEIVSRCYATKTIITEEFQDQA